MTTTEMSDKLYLNSIQLKGNNAPSWNGIPDEVWQTILSDFFFKLADSFGFMTVVEKKNLFSKGLHFFESWHLDNCGLVEVENDIVCKFELNENCKQKLLENEFAVHQIGMMPPRDYRDFDEQHYYYEFDELCFFAEDRLIGIFINHEDTIEFRDLNKKELGLLNLLDQKIKSDIIDKVDFRKAIEDKRSEL
jgi:hypothetical protein